MSGEESVDWRAAYTYLEQQLELVLARVADRMENLESGGRCRVRGVTLRQLDSGELESIVLADGVDLSYSFVVHRDGAVVREQVAGPSNTLVWRPSRSGTYRVDATALSGGTEADTARSGEVAVTVGKR